MQTLFSVNELAQRWGLDPSTIRQMERDGKLHRLPEIPGVKFSAMEVFKLESVGKDAEPLSPWERKRMQDEINDLEQQLAEYKKRHIMAQQVLQGGLT
jgi:hypothetical protein